MVLAVRLSAPPPSVRHAAV